MDLKTETEEKKVASEGTNSAMEKLVEDTNKRIETLTVAFTDKASEIEELHNIVLEQEKNFSDQISSLTSKNEALKQALDSVTKAKEEAELQLKQIAEEAMLRERLSTLRDSGILRSEEQAQVKQAEKVKTMSNEDFAAYVEDLLDTRNQALNSIKTSEDKTEEVVVEPKVESEKTEDLAAEVIKTETESATDSAQDIIKKVLESISVKKASDKAEKVEVEAVAAASKEAASVKTSEFDVKKLQAAFTGILNMSPEKTEKEGWL